MRSEGRAGRDDAALERFVDAEAYAEAADAEPASKSVPDGTDPIAARVAAARRQRAAQQMREQAIAADEIPRARAPQDPGR